MYGKRYKEVRRMIYDVNGNALDTAVPGISINNVLVAAVLDANSDSARFTAMKQLLDIGKRKLDNPNAVITDSDFTYATKGAVCLLPLHNTGMREKYTFEMLYSKNASIQAVPASVTKVMSLITGMDYIGNVKEVVTLKSADLVGGSGAYFSAGDTMTIQEMMLAMMLPSSNTAATAWGRICGAKMLEADGTTTYSDADCVAKFVEKMNEKAAYIGMSNSVFVSPSGLNNNLTTVTDLIQMVIEACSYPEILKVWNKKTYTIPVGGTNPRDVSLTTTVTNSAIEGSYTILGGKTGSLTSPAAASLVMVAEAK